jgi:SWI/SNF-related matrix-associated actin-dependent regulator 1 of chromatin subfamily A
VGPVVIEDESDEEDDQALMECARISRRLRRALGHDDDAKGKSDGPLSPGGRASSEPRRLVTAQDVAAVAGDGSRANGLKPYQMVGVNFLLLLDEQDVPGAILADEMGLGKTAQTIAYLACSRAGNALPASADVAKRMRRRRNEPALVVAPASLLENWRRELDDVGARAARGLLPRRSVAGRGARHGGGVGARRTRGWAVSLGRRSLRRHHRVLFNLRAVSFF